MTNPNYRTTPFDAPGVWLSASPGVTVTLTPATETAGMRADPTSFELIRLIGNLKFTSTSDRATTHFRFDPPVHLQVRYSADDETRATRVNEHLALAWWNGQNWVRFQVGSTRVVPGRPLEGGMRYFDVSEIDDPPIGWGA